jgi:hypothetical protein
MRRRWPPQRPSRSGPAGRRWCDSTTMHEPGLRPQAPGAPRRTDWPHPVRSSFLFLSLCIFIIDILRSTLMACRRASRSRDPRREDFTIATHSTPNSSSAAVTGAGGGLPANLNGQHRGSSAQRGTGADRRHRHVSDRRARLQSLRDPASGDPPATTGRASRGLWAQPSTTGLPRNSIWAITLRNSRGTRVRSAP